MAAQLVLEAARAPAVEAVLVVDEGAGEALAAHEALSLEAREELGLQLLRQLEALHAAA